eukprot:m.26486 g.26486  ORF g.26486 m.26486 type:complete len:136 (+) comp13773_c0_seq2:1759-2166(+)
MASSIVRKLLAIEFIKKEKASEFLVLDHDWSIVDGPRLLEQVQTALNAPDLPGSWHLLILSCGSQHYAQQRQGQVVRLVDPREDENTTFSLGAFVLSPEGAEVLVSAFLPLTQSLPQMILDSQSDFVVRCAVLQE